MFHKPLLPSHFSVWYEPPDELGEEVLRIVSGRRSIKLKGHAFREFNRRVMPLLDGKHTMEEIAAATSDVFMPEDLTAALEMLGSQGIVVEGGSEGLADGDAERLAPQLNYFHEMAEGGRNLQSRLATARVAVIGLGGAGATTALNLAAAGIGKIVCVDPHPVTPADLYFSPFLDAADVGSSRAEKLRDQAVKSSPQVEVEAVTEPIETEEQLWRAIEGCDFVVSCLDAGMLNLAYKLNKVCLRYSMPWLAVSLEGAEVVVGPLFYPHSGPCYMCYRMRSVACTGNPEASFAVERHLDRTKTDLSSSRESLVFGAGIAANLAGIEVVAALTGTSVPLMAGRLITIDLQDLRTQKHTVLRKPWCPACMEQEQT